MNRYVWILLAAVYVVVGVQRALDGQPDDTAVCGVFVGYCVWEAWRR